MFKHTHRRRLANFAICALPLACVMNIAAQDSSTRFQTSPAPVLLAAIGPDGKAYAVHVDSNGALVTSGTSTSGPGGTSINWRGTYSSASSYAIGDAVTLNGSSYLAIAGSSSSNPQNPATATAYWGLLASAGANGTSGQGFSFKGAWTASTAYNPYDIVTNNGSAYVVTTAFTSGASFSTANLGLLVSAGTNGASIAPPTNYASGNTYAQYALVTSGGVVYQAQQAVPISTPPVAGTTTAYWAPVADAAGAAAAVATNAQNASTLTSGVLDPARLPTSLTGSLPVLPSASTMLFDYAMPASDAGNSSYFTDYSTADGSTVGVGNCTFLGSGHNPTLLPLGGAQFATVASNAYAGCNIPAAANSLRTVIVMTKSAVENGTSVQPTFPLVMGSNGANNGPYLMTRGNRTGNFGYAAGMFGVTYTDDSTSGLTCVAYQLGTAGDSTYDALYIKGLPVGSYSVGPGRTGLNTSGNWVLGASSLGVNGYYLGSIYRAVGYSSYLSAGLIRSACNILSTDAANKGAVDPAVTPNTSTTPTLSATGDSIEAGTGNTGGVSPSTQLTGLPTLTVNVNAIGGTYTWEQLWQVASREAAQCTTGAMNYAVDESASNDLFAGGSAVTTAIAMKLRWAQAVRAAWYAKGCSGKIGFQTVISRSGINTGNAGYVASVAITNAGTGYVQGSTTVTSTGGGCTTQPTYAFIVSGGALTLINPINGGNAGSGCTSAPTISIGGVGTGATATATISTAGNGLRDIYNPAIRATLGNGADFIVDAANDPVIGKNNSFLDQTNFGTDFTHPKPAGYLLIAADKSNALLAAMSSTANVTTVTAATYSMLSSDRVVNAQPASANQTITLPTCVGLHDVSYRIVALPSAYTVTLKALNSTQQIWGADYSSTGLTVGVGSPLTLRAMSNPVAVGGCGWQ